MGIPAPGLTTHCTLGSAKSYSASCWRDKLGTLARYCILSAEAVRCEVPICLGGDNGSPLNLWPEPWDEAQEKT